MTGKKTPPMKAYRRITLACAAAVLSATALTYASGQGTQADASTVRSLGQGPSSSMTTSADTPSRGPAAMTRPRAQRALPVVPPRWVESWSSPAGAPRDWTHIVAGKPMAWNSCEEITWSYDPAGGYPGSLLSLHKAFSIVAAHTGFRFEYAGAGARGDIRVGWSNAGRTPLLAGPVLAVAGPSYVPIDPRRNGRVKGLIVAGSVTLDSGERAPRGFTRGGRSGWGQVMVHEIGHVVGLGHARSDAHIMNAVEGGHLIGAGDRSGLAAVGSRRTCLRARPARLGANEGSAPTQVLVAE